MTCKNPIIPASLLAGTIIGAGIFALPFVFGKAGIVSGLAYLAVFSAVFILIHLMYADVIAKTGEERRFSGYAGIYLGKPGFWLANLAAILGMILVLTVYLVLSASFFNLILPANFVVPDFVKILFFWLLGSLAIFLEIRKMSFLEFLTTFGVVLAAFLVFVFGFGNAGKFASIPVFDLKNIFLPYGAILFALSGRVAIPALLDYFKKTGQPVAAAKKSIVWGTLVPSFVYLLFVFGVLGLSGTVSEDAVSGLIGVASPVILVLVGVFGLVSIWDSYFVVGLDVKNSLKFDLKLPEFLAGFGVVALPLILYVCGLQKFLALVAVGGGIFTALEGILIVLMWLKSLKTGAERVFIQKLSPAIAYALLLVFAGGMVYELIRWHG